MWLLGAVQPAPALQLVLVHDRAGVAVRQTVLVGQPVGALVAPEERGAGFEPAEPLSGAYRSTQLIGIAHSAGCEGIAFFSFVSAEGSDHPYQSISWRRL